MAASSSLERYNAKRDFARTPEPSGEAGAGGEQLAFVIQKHWASHLHYDFRLELDGVLLSWAVPKGPSCDPSVKRMAIHVEDHPVSYGGFEGTIPAKQYGAGNVIVWDRGTWEPLADPREGMKNGKVVFALHGEKLAGQWELVRIAKPDDRQEAWLLFKKRDRWARPQADYDVVSALPDSVIAKPLGPAEARGDGDTVDAGAGDVASSSKAKKSSPATVKVPGKSRAARADAAPAPVDPSAPGASSIPDGAVKAALPEQLAPQLATLAKEPPAEGDWSVEAKFDGYRILARIHRGRARLVTRNGNDWTDRLASVAQAVEALGLDEGWFDGEIVVARAEGGQDFNALQNAIDRSSSESIVYFLFDAPYLGGYDLRHVPLRERRAVLKRVVEQGAVDRIRYSDDFPASPAEVLKAACAMQLEGVIIKRRDAHYASSRNDQWLKLKCSLRQEFVIGGYSDRSNSSTEIGNLFLGVYEDGKLRYAGAMGTGWTLATARELKERLKPLERPTSPFETGSMKQSKWTRRVAGSEHWVEPRLVAEATFAEWTPDGHLRHASFQGLREDKPARSIVRERPVDPPPSGSAVNAADASSSGSHAQHGRSAKSTPAGKGQPTAAAKSAARPATKSAGGTAKATRNAAPKSSDEEPAARPSGNSTTSSKGTSLVDGIKVSSGERVIDAASGATKLDLVRYYDSVADAILPHLAGRPVSLVRGPRGVGGELFFQKHLDAKIAGVTELDRALWPEHASMMQIDTKEALLSAAQMNTIEFHTWNAKSTAVGTPDRMIFDLDPGEGVQWAQIREGAALTRALLEELGLVSFLKTSGGKGLHVVVPLTPRADWDTVKGFSQAVVRHLAKTIPDRFVAKSGSTNRVGKIFVDYIRNGLGATTAVAFSARARPGLGVSMTVAWEDLDALKGGDQWTVATARDELSFRRSDPWAGYARTRQTLTAAMKALGYPGGA